MSEASHDSAQWMQEDQAASAPSGQLVPSDSGATLTCPKCGTIYDAWAVDISDYVPPVGDGCDHCSQDDKVDDFLRGQGIKP